MPRINNRVEPQWMEFDASNNGGAWEHSGGGGGGINELYARLGSRVADLPGFGTMWADRTACAAPRDSR